MKCMQPSYVCWKLTGGLFSLSSSEATSEMVSAVWPLAWCCFLLSQVSVHWPEQPSGSSMIGWIIDIQTMAVWEPHSMSPKVISLSFSESSRLERGCAGGRLLRKCPFSSFLLSWLILSDVPHTSTGISIYYGHLGMPTSILLSSSYQMALSPPIHRASQTVTMGQYRAPPWTIHSNISANYESTIMSTK